MQDIHSITNGGRLFNPGGGDRRLRPHHHQNHQALKCPRCDSLNTKFCYYNNYNLSQPRHFCKNCRRYWTKGGVLRNVPVGGGCRKTKRSKPKQNTSSTTENTTITGSTTATTSTAAAAGNIPQPQQREEVEGKPSNSHSSSESSSLTANNTTVVSNTGNLEAVSAHSSSSASNVNNNTNHIVLNGMGESKLFVHTNNFENSGLLEQSSGADCGGIFSEIETFSSLMSSNNDHMQHGFGNMMNYHQNLEQVQQNQNLMQQQQDMKSMHDMGMMDQTAHVEFSRSGNGFGALDWQVGGDGNDHQSLFDLTNGVDQNSYWNQSQWTTDHDQDQPGLYLP